MSASLDPCWTNLGRRPSWPILGASWSQELPRHLPDGCACAPVSPSWPILGSIVRAQNCLKQLKIATLFPKNKSKLVQTWTQGAPRSPKKPKTEVAPANAGETQRTHRKADTARPTIHCESNLRKYCPTLSLSLSLALEPPVTD